MEKLSKIRLSLYLPPLFIFFLLLINYVPKINLLISYIALFSASIILLGFYLNPLLIQNKARIENLVYLISVEASVFYRIDLELDKVNDSHRDQIIKYSKEYLNIKIHSKDSKKSDAAYLDIINFCRDLKHDATIYKILIILSDNNQTRANIAFQLRNRVYSSEWLIMTMLYLVAVGFIVGIELPPHSLTVNCILSILATGISFAMLFLWKLSNLTHKKALGMWQPLIDLKNSNFIKMTF